MAGDPPKNPSDLQRDLGRRRPKMSRGEPWIGGELDRGGEVTPAYPGTGTSLPQDIGADGFEVEPPPDEPRDELLDTDTDTQESVPGDEFDFDALNSTPGFDGTDARLSALDPGRPSRVDRLNDEETPLDERETDRMVHSGEIGELPSGSESVSPGELARYDCPNCGFEYDVVVGTASRCPRCQYEADLSNYVGDEAFHYTFSVTDPGD